MIVFKSCLKFKNHINKGLSLIKKFSTLDPISNGITRFHGRFRYDENYKIKEDTKLQDSLIEKENERMKAIMPEFEKYYLKYFETSEKRKEIPSKPLPEKNGPYYYFSKHNVHNENDYDIIYRRKIGSDNEEVVIDLITIPFLKKRELNTAALTKLVLSDNQNILGYIVDPKNDENLVAGFKDLKTGNYLRDKLYNCANLVFSKKYSNIVYYVEHDDNKRTNKIKKHIIGNDQEDDITILEEKDEQFYLDIKVSKDKKYFIIHSSSKSCNEILIMNRDEESNTKPIFNVLLSRKTKMRAFCNHSDNKFLIVGSDKTYFDSKLLMIPDDKSKTPDSPLQVYYSPKDGEIITEIDIFQDYNIIYLDRQGVSCIKIMDKMNNSEYDLDMGNLAGRIEPAVNEDYDTETFMFHFSNPFIYNSVYEYNMKTKRLHLLKETELTGPKFKKENYVVNRINVPSPDGEQIPMTLLHKKQLKLNRQNKVMLIGYGAYGQSLDINFNIVTLSALENKWIIAFAHVRGGNELGRRWHEAGMKNQKINSFYDFISCAEYLIGNGYTHPSLLCAYGSSAGGLLIGSVINIRPDLFKAVVLNVPFLDVLTSLLDEKLPLTLSDHEEFGDPIQNEISYDIITSYCPYENITPKQYPPIYISSGKNDYRCPVWHTLKYAARFRQKAKTNENLKEFTDKNLLVNIIDSGHGGEVGTMANIKEKCLNFAFYDYVIHEASQEITVKETLFG